MKADKKILETIKNKLVEAYDPLAIHLFGSHVWGEPGKDSDYDFLGIAQKLVGRIQPNIYIRFRHFD